MAMLEIDGVGKVEIEDGFLALSPEKQAAEVDAIASTLKPPAIAATAPLPAGDEIVKRGSILPVGRTAAGDIVPALPEFAENARQKIKGLMDGALTADQISGRDMFDIMGVLGLIPGTTGMAAAGTGAGIARAAAQRAAPTVERAGVAAETPSAATAAAEQVLKPDASPAPAEVPVPPPVAAEPILAAPTTAAEIKAAAKSYYKQAEDAGVIIGAPKIKSLADDVVKATVEAGIDPTLHPRSSAALKRIADIAEEPITFERLEIIRRVANAAGKGMDKDEGRIAGVIKDKIDDMIGSLKAEDLISGNAKVAAETVTKARELWSKSAKLDKVDDLVDRAATSASGYTGSGFENALRSEFRALAKNANQMRTFTAEEQAAIKKVARGTVAGNTARNVGKLAPTGVVSMALGGGAGAAIGSAIGMPVAGALAVGSLGFAGRRLATVLTKRNVASLEKLIASGGNSEMATASLQRSRALLAALEGGIKATKTGSGKAGPAAAVQGDQRRK